MADGITHNKYLRMGWFFIIPLGWLLYLMAILLDGGGYSFLYLIFTYITFYLCEFCDPDNDHLSLTNSEGRVLRLSKRIYMGFFGALFVSYTFIYSYIIGLFGGHRSWASHGWVIGTVGRMIFYNIPFFGIFYFLYGYGLMYWGWTTDIDIFRSFGMEVWLKPFLISQFFAWNVGDGIHLILDTEWAKGTLYEPEKRKR